MNDEFRRRRVGFEVFEAGEGAGPKIAGSPPVVSEAAGHQLFVEAWGAYGGQDEEILIGTARTRWRPR